jgi:hypothetical protein
VWHESNEFRKADREIARTADRILGAVDALFRKLRHGYVHHDSFTIAEWCKHRRVSISMYYKLRTQGKAPATLPVGRHQTITAEADAAWARERQAEANAEDTA